MAPPPVRSVLGRLRAALVLLPLFSFPASALASDATPLTTFRGGGLTITVRSPTLASTGSRIDCAPGSDGCYLLNRAACTGNPLPIEFVLSAPLAQSPPVYGGGTQVLYAFLANTPSCIYSTNTAQVGANGVLLGTTAALPSSSVFFAGGSLPFGFPAGLSALNGNAIDGADNNRFTTVDFMNALGVCPESGGTAVDLSPRYLCIGVDGSGSKGGVNNGTAATSSTTTGATANASTTDLVGYLALQVDTSPPVTPTALSVQPKNARANVSVRYDASTNDVYKLAVRYTDDEQDLAAGNVLVGTDGNAQTAGCASWGHYRETSVMVRGATNGNRLLPVSNLSNGNNWAFCAVSYDYLGNASEPTPIVVAQPRYECDLFECYDGTLRVGFCAASELPTLWSAAAIGCAVASVRRRRRRRRGNAPSLLGLVLVALAAGGTMMAPLAAQAAVTRQPPYLQSEAPKDDPKHRPRGSGEDTFTAEQSAGRPSTVQFSDPRTESLNYGPAQPLSPLFDVDFAIGPYRPDIASGPPAQAYDLIYGQHDGSLFKGRPLRLRVGGAFFPFRQEQTGPYVAAGFWHASGASRVCTAADGGYAACTPATVLQSQRGVDSGSLFVVPLSMGWIYAFDFTRWNRRVPVSIGAKAGLVFNLWWARNGSRPSLYRGAKAQGSTANGELAAFVAVDLNGFTARTRRLRQHVLGFAEYQYLPSGALFGSDRSHRLSFGSPAMVTLGLRVQFLH